MSVLSSLYFQKMDRNKDGVVTIEEFIESCQKVNVHIWMYMSLCTRVDGLIPAIFPFLSLQDENIMQSMQLFDNVI